MAGSKPPVWAPNPQLKRTISYPYRHLYESGIAVSTTFAVLWLYFGLLGGETFFTISLFVFLTQFLVAVTLKRKQHFGVAALIAWLPGVAFVALSLAVPLVNAARKLFFL